MLRAPVRGVCVEMRLCVMGWRALAAAAATTTTTGGGFFPGLEGVVVIAHALRVGRSGIDSPKAPPQDQVWYGEWTRKRKYKKKPRARAATRHAGKRAAAERDKPKGQLTGV